MKQIAFSEKDPEGKIQISLSRPSTSPKVKIVNINLKKPPTNFMSLSKFDQNKKSKMVEKLRVQQMRRETQIKLNKSRSVTKG